MLEEKLRRDFLMDEHRKMIRRGEYEEGKILLELFQNGKVKLGLDDPSWNIEMLCEKFGCQISYDKRGYSAIIFLKK